MTYLGHVLPPSFPPCEAYPGDSSRDGADGEVASELEASGLMAPIFRFDAPHITVPASIAHVPAARLTSGVDLVVSWLVVIVPIRIPPIAAASPVCHRCEAADGDLVVAKVPAARIMLGMRRVTQVEHRQRTTEESTGAQWEHMLCEI